MATSDNHHRQKVMQPRLSTAAVLLEMHGQTKDPRVSTIFDSEQSTILASLMDNHIHQSSTAVFSLD
jgi:hypothetical protein